MDKCIINMRAHIFESYILNRSWGKMGEGGVYSDRVKGHLDFFHWGFFSDI